MPNEPESVMVQISEDEHVTALVYSPPRGARLAVTIILGHGAGANQSSGFMRLFANGLAARGCHVVTFNFLYTERGRRVPDPKAKLESCYLAVISAAQRHAKLKGNSLAIGGKSMGGRIASQVAAIPSPTTSGKTRKRFAGEPAATSALVFLGYPLHPPGKPEQLRTAHLPQINAPMLFIQGSRDAFGTPAELSAVIKEFNLPGELYVVEDGDHSFKVPKSSAVSQTQVYDAVMDEIVRWLKAK